MSEVRESLDSAMLIPRKRQGLPPRRRIGGIQLTILSVVAGVVLGSGAAEGGVAGASAAVPPLIVLGAVALVSSVIVFGVSRSRLKTLRERLASGSEAVPVRTTADFSRFPPGEVSFIESYTRPWHTYQMLTLTDSGVELRAMGKSGWSGGALLRYDRIESVTVGVAAFGDYTERAILISGQEKSRTYYVGIVPVDETSMLLRPVIDGRYHQILKGIISNATGTVQ